jgi:aspartyl-tRNA(Asn)/glutamyl-tRNA(Gln) amidotransferase subunit C
MFDISKEEIKKLAQNAQLRVDDHEIELFITQIKAVLAYAQRVKEVVSAETEEVSNKNVNVFREDIVVRTDAELILDQAPQREADFFVVPAILEQK